MASRTLAFRVLLVLGSLTAACGRNAPGEVKAESVRAGDELVAAEKYAEAVEAYRRAVSADPRDGAVRFKLARTLEQAQQWTQAAREAMRAADLLPGDFEARRLAARLVLAQSRYADSITITTALLQERPDDPELLALWGTATARLINSSWALYRLGRTGGAGPEYDRGCTDVRPRVGPDQDRAAEEALRRAVKLAPRASEPRLALVNFLWAARRAEESTEMLRRLADEMPTHGVVNEAVGHFLIAHGQAALGRQYLANAASAPDPFSRAARVALVDHYLAEERFADALAVLEQMTVAEDEAGAVSLRQADALLALARHDEAARELDGLLTRFPRNARALTLKARLLLTTNRADEALAPAREAVAADAAASEAHLVLADILSAKGDIDAAFDAYGEAIKFDPGATELSLTLARLAVATGRPRVALVYARQAATQYPHDMEARLTVAAAHIGLGDYAAAESALVPLQTIQPVPPEVQVQLGRLHAGRGSEPAARLAFEAALRERPDAVDALTGLVDLDLGRGQIGAARRRVDQALAARPGDGALLRLAGRIRLAEGDLRGAEAALGRALKAQPADTEAAFLLADTLSSLRRHDEAKRLLEQVLERRPSWLAAQTSSGRVLEQLGRTDDAYASYEAILTEHPESTTAMARLAILDVARKRDLGRALSRLTLARRTAPTDPELHEALGWVYLHRDQPALALTHLTAAAASSPRNAGVQYRLGVALAQTGDPQKAREALAKALAHEAAFPERAQAEATFSALPR